MTSCSLRCTCGWSGKGTYYYQDEDQHKNDFHCPKCRKETDLNFGPRVAAQPAFPFTSTHISGDGNPVTVESYRHLQQIEKQYGVNIVRTGEESHKGDLPKFRPGGRDVE